MSSELMQDFAHLLENLLATLRTLCLKQERGHTGQPETPKGGTGGIENNCVEFSD